MTADERRKAWHKARYDTLKAGNICVICGQRKAMEGRVRCAECNDRRRRQMDDPEKRQFIKDHNRRRYYDLKEKGLCTECGKEKATHGVYCDACYLRDRKRRLLKRREA